jgi:hypothetical protein
MGKTDLTGNKYGHWIVLGRGLSGKETRWQVKCSCGTERQVPQSRLLSGDSCSCGCRFRNRKSSGKNLRSLVLWSYKHNAKTRRLDWELSNDEAYGLFESPCHYCGVVGSNCKIKNKRTPYYYNGIDRMDNEVGYCSGNVVPCCGFCNIFKRAMPYEKFIAYLNQVAVFRGALQ